VLHLEGLHANIRLGQKWLFTAVQGFIASATRGRFLDFSAEILS